MTLALDMKYNHLSGLYTPIISDQLRKTEGAAIIANHQIESYRSNR